MELTLGPVLFEWKRDDVIRFYDEVSSLPVDRVFIGEVVCTKKLGLAKGDIEKIAARLVGSGKKVVLSSLAVVSNEEELEFTRRLVELPYPIEANDMSVLNMVDPAKREVFAGPHITTYNVPSMEFLKGIGVRRAALPVELPRESVAHIISNTGIFTEVFAHGKAPLAFSWRCYTSRAHGLTKTECRHHCAKYPDGLEIRTMDREDLFTINGTSILSTKTYTLIEYIEDLKDIGVGAIRLSPQAGSMAKVVEVFRKRIDGAIGAAEGLEMLKGTAGGFCNGWYPGRAGKDYIVRAAERAATY